jgi:hypothetical protein
VWTNSIVNTKSITTIKRNNSIIEDILGPCISVIRGFFVIIRETKTMNRIGFIKKKLLQEKFRFKPVSLRCVNMYRIIYWVIQNACYTKVNSMI